jgi:predicted ATPase
MVNIVEHLVQQQLVVRREGQWTLREKAEAKVASLPEGLRQFIVRRIEELPPETRQVLEAGSVVGEEFAVTTVAAGIQYPMEDVEARCARLAARHHFIEDTGVMVWPNEISSGRYRFQHALYQQVLYEQLGTARRQDATGRSLLAAGGRKCRPAQCPSRGGRRPHQRARAP